MLIVKIEEPLFFANTGNERKSCHGSIMLTYPLLFLSGQLKDRLRRLEYYGDMSTHPSEQPRLGASLYTIFDVDNMPYIDASAVQIMDEIVESYHARNVTVYFVRLREKPKAMFQRAGLLDRLGPEHLVQEVSQAIEAIEKDMAKRGIYVQ